eukprot:540186-Prymnesium_polylepis.1
MSRVLVCDLRVKKKNCAERPPVLNFNLELETPTGNVKPNAPLTLFALDRIGHRVWSNAAPTPLNAATQQLKDSCGTVGGR